MKACLGQLKEKEAEKRKVTVINAPDANSQAVAEMTVSLMLSLLRKLQMFAPYYSTFQVECEHGFSMQE